MAVDKGDPTFLSVRETARRLGVHENTVRNWVRAGTLRTAKLPGSRFLRFESAEVERLRQQKGGPVPSVGEQSRTIGPELIDATQLSHWSTTRDAQDKFPELVRRLLAATPGITNVFVRASEGVSAEGWDGRAESSGTNYLPQGPLCFEFGVGGRVKAKADEDYEKRRANPVGISPSESVFIFATPRRWTAAEKWARERRAEGIFSDVQVLDADKLEGWLQDTPAVHHWLSEQLGRRPGDAETLERWWARFQRKTDPPLPASLFLSGRAAERKQLEEFFRGPPDVITVEAPWRNDAIAFVCATIETLETESNSPVQPPIIVSSAEVWDRIVVSPGRMTLMPQFEDPDIATAESRGHHVVLAIGREQIARGKKIELQRPHRQQAAEALEAVGIDSDRTYELAALARRSMPSLIRKLARDPRMARPPWAQMPASGVLAPLMLLGAWTSSEKDEDVVTRMASEPWPTIERALLDWRATEDPPFLRTSGVWHLASPEEAFLLLQGALTSDDLQKWRVIAVEVLLEGDPTLELPPEDRPMAGVKGIGREHSSNLRKGIAEALILLRSTNAGRLSDGVSGADHARRVVHDIFSRAAADASGLTWQSLSYELPLLAEAAPQDFLDAVHDDLDRPKPLLATMFQDHDQSSLLYSSSAHTGLLWALETLCWSSEFFPDASLALARLQQIDPGGRLANRPLESLRNILTGWIRHTSASIDLRIRAIEQICSKAPEVGWRLLLALLPSPHSIAMPPSSPRYHDWKPESRGVVITEWMEFIERIVQIALRLAENDAARWADLVDHLGPLPEPERDRMLESLNVVSREDSFDAPAQLLLWERLHKVISRHRQFPSADWVMPDATLVRMQDIANRLEPTSNVERFSYLFDWRPDLPGFDPFDHATFDKKLMELRMEAVRETIEVGHTEGLRQLAERVPVPNQLGWTLGAFASEEVTSELFAWLDSERRSLRETAISWAAKRLVDGGIAWLRLALNHPNVNTKERSLTVALNVPARADYWDALFEIDPTLVDAYWSGMNPWGVRPIDAGRAVQELLARDRAWAGVDVLAAALHDQEDGPPSLDTALVEEVLNAAAAADPSEAQSQSPGYEVGMLLDYLESKNCPRERLGGYEFVFFRLLEDHRQPRALFEALATEPGLFVDLIRRVYRGRNEAPRQLDKREEARAHQAWWVLHHWRDLPGRREDGSVDGEHLSRWITEARLALAELDRADIGDEQIGQVLANSPPGSDDIWPAEPVRDIIETIGTSLESGFHIGVLNNRGVTTRGVFDGGEQERELAARYRGWANQTAGTWRRTSRVLRGLAEDFERQAEREDESAQLRADIE